MRNDLAISQYTGNIDNILTRAIITRSYNHCIHVVKLEFMLIITQELNPLQSIQEINISHPHRNHHSSKLIKAIIDQHINKYITFIA